MKILLKGLNNPNIENDKSIKTINIPSNDVHESKQLKQLIYDNFTGYFENKTQDDFSLYSNGSFCEDYNINLKNNQIFEIKFILLGGKVIKYNNLFRVDLDHYLKVNLQ